MSGRERAFAQKLGGGMLPGDRNSVTSSGGRSASGGILSHRNSLTSTGGGPLIGPGSFPGSGVRRGGTVSGQLWQEEVADPVDFELFVLQCEQPFAEYPNQDLQAELQEQSAKKPGADGGGGGGGGSWGADADLMRLDQHTADCLHQYEKPLLTIHRTHAHISPQFSSPQRYLAKLVSILTRLEYEDNVANAGDILPRPLSSICLQMSAEQADPLLDTFFHLIEQPFKSTLEANRQNRLTDLHRFPELMGLFALETPPCDIDRSLRNEFTDNASYLSVRCLK